MILAAVQCEYCTSCAKSKWPDQQFIKWAFSHDNWDAEIGCGLTPHCLQNDQASIRKMRGLWEHTRTTKTVDMNIDSCQGFPKISLQSVWPRVRHKKTSYLQPLAPKEKVTRGRASFAQPGIEPGTPGPKTQYTIHQPIVSLPIYRFISMVTFVDFVEYVQRRGGNLPDTWVYSRFLL